MTGASGHILVAGGAGFIGSHLCAALLRHGQAVTCLDNLATGSLANTAEYRDQPRFTFVRGQVEEAPAGDYALVLHLASPASPIHYRRLALETMSANAAGTQRLLEVARACGARFVFVSTSEVYGDPLEHPQREGYHGNVNPIGPRACYDESKRFGEALTMEYRRCHGVSAAIVRLFNTYGPRMALGDGRVIPAFIQAALAGEPLPIFGDGGQTRSFCYVDDIVEGLLHVAFDGGADGEVFNLGNPAEMTLLELAGAVRRATGSAAPLAFLPPVEDDPARRKPDISRMRGRYSWEPRVGLDAGLHATTEDFRARLGLPAALGVGP